LHRFPHDGAHRDRQCAQQNRSKNNRAFVQYFGDRPIELSGK
jgi:hypothetical protein